MSALPLSSLSIFPATREQIRESRTRSFKLWGRGTTLDQYLERDARVMNHESAKNHRIITWVLARRDSPTALDFLCSCETSRRDGLFVQPSARAGQTNIVEEVDGYVVGSVFTPVENRGEGYAKHLMHLLHWVIGRREFLPLNEFPTSEWGSPPERPAYVKEGHFSTLYSELGPHFYEMTGPTLQEGGGWRVAEPISTMWDVDDVHARLSLTSTLCTSHDHWRWLDKDSVVAAFDADAGVMKRELLLEEAAPRPVVFTYLPTHGAGDFHIYRLQQFWRNMRPVPVYWGLCNASNDPSVLDVSTFASWTLDYRPAVMNRLIITRLRSSQDNFLALLFQIVDFAKRHSVEEIEVWGLPPHLRSLAAHAMGRTFMRDEHLPSYKLYGVGSEVEELKNVYWAYNEKFSR